VRERRAGSSGDAGNLRRGPAVLYGHAPNWRGLMGKGILLWLIGVPIPVILLLWLFFH
jgi:hypothetical protein